MSIKQELLSKLVILCVLPAFLVMGWVLKNGVRKPKLNVATREDSVLVITKKGDKVLVPTTLYNELFVFDEPYRESMLEGIAQMVKDGKVDKKMIPSAPAQEVPGAPRNQSNQD